MAAAISMDTLTEKIQNLRHGQGMQKMERPNKALEGYGESAWFSQPFQYAEPQGGRWLKE